MLTAFNYDRLISLNTIDRQELQKIYEAGKNGLLACSVCGEAVKLYLGIKSAPYFYHYSSKLPCMTEDVPNVQQEHAATIDINDERTNGFRIPKSRSISKSVTESTSFKPPMTIKATIHTSELANSLPVTYPKESYLNILDQNGYSLDATQSKAVTIDDGPILVLAGAGSGKTRVLTMRAAFLIHEKNVNPSTIMLVTFTNKAANEMKERLLHYPKMNKGLVQKIISGTFHSILYQILIFHEREKWQRNQLLSSNWQRELLLKEIAREKQIDEKDFPFDAALQLISAWKNSMLSPSDVEPNNDWEQKVAQLYTGYETKKQQQNQYDFDDMLLGGYHFFLENPAILATYQKRFTHFLLDEFQDINKVQYEWIKLMAGSAKSIYAVGDDDQSIYSFRGSDPKYLLNFEKDYPNSQTIILDYNYRSSQEIVSAAKSTISKNTKRRAKKMITGYSGKHPLAFYPYDEEEEATMILTDIQEKIKLGYEPKDFAILFRTNTNSRAMFERLASSSLPFRLEQDIGSFYQRFIVKSMLAYLKLIHDPDNQQAVVDILPTLFLKKTVLQDIKAMSILEDCSFLDCLHFIKTGFAFQESRLKKIPDTLKRLMDRSPLDAINYIEKELGFQEFIKKRGNEGNQWDKGSDDIRDLKVVARKFNSIKEFVQYTDHMMAMNEELRKQFKNESNVITLSTIHRAKGLEYKTVYILGAVDGSIPHDFALESFRNNNILPLEEERRLLYVAMTRAQQGLFLSIPMYLRGKKAKESRFLSPLSMSPFVHLD
ncbi:UvrD-helicase domain-containing protein [Niallia sp. JL1B1071]|uniref:UvrD-helicase domain-containing protein n=1 Tax=Niallia tiangongensis TaxID=3237105 RepID=UPI0037DCD128